MKAARAPCGNRRVTFRHHSGPSGRLIRGQLLPSIFINIAFMPIPPPFPREV